MPRASQGTLSTAPKQVEDPEGAVVPAGRRSPWPGPPRRGRTSPGRWPRPGPGAGGRRCSAPASPGRTATTPPPPRTPARRPRRRAYGTRTLRKRAQSRYPGVEAGPLGRRGGVIPDARRIPEATVARLPLYYRALLETADQEIGTVSSERLAELAGVNAAKVRKDLSYLGLLRHPRASGTTSSTCSTRSRASSASPTTGRSPSSASGNLGQALANYRGLRRPRLPRRGAGRRRPRRRSASRSATSTIESLDDLPDDRARARRRHRHHRHARARGAGGGRPPRRRGRHARSSTSRRRS